MPRQPMVLSQLRNELRKIRSALWFRPGLMSATAGLLAVLLVSFDTALAGTLPVKMLDIDRGTVQQVLRFMAGGMLTVTTVTQSVLMLVLSLAAGQASPRTVPELMADRVTQNALGIFLAALVFSLSALTGMEFGVVEPAAVAWIFIAALLLLAAAIKYLVQWIHHVADTMKLNRIIERIYVEAREVMVGYLDADREAARREAPSKGEDTCAISPNCAGYVQLIDTVRLDELAEDGDIILELAVREGDFVHPGAPLATVWSKGPTGSELRLSVREAVVIGPERSPEGDPLLGFELLTEIACRALSSSVNDPQTAVVCIHYLGALLSDAGTVPPGRYPDGKSPSGRFSQPAIDFDMMVVRAIRPIVREGCDSAEVVFEVTDTLLELAGTVAVDYLPRILEEGQRTQEHAADCLVLTGDKNALSEKLTRLHKAVERRRNAIGQGAAPAG